jgi:peptidoglycan hydrolase-like amidase
MIVPIKPTPTPAQLKRIRTLRAQRIKQRLAQKGKPLLKVGVLRLVLPLLTVAGVGWALNGLVRTPALHSAAVQPGATLSPPNISESLDLETSAPGASPASPALTQSASPAPIASPVISAAPSTPPRANTPLPAVPSQGLSAIAPVSPQTRAPEIRVVLAQELLDLGTGSSTPGYIRDDQGNLLGQLPANQAVPVQVNPEGRIQVGTVLTSATTWIQASQGGYVYLDGRWYRGRLRLIAQNRTCIVVNYVDLEQYVASVVGAEVSPSWPMHALKAQAIAARSYAVAHALRPPDRFFDLGNDQRWQVYQGVEDEWNTTRAAVRLTRGIVLSRSGTVMVSMYAATDDIVQDVFGGEGMSQTGALELAEQGYTYLQILGAYYPGASLARLQAK